MGDRVVEGCVHRRRDSSPFELLRADGQLLGGHLDAIEPGQRIAHGRVAPLPDVVDECCDRLPERRVEDVVQPSAHEGGPRVAVHVVPHLPAHHRIDATVTGWCPTSV